MAILIDGYNLLHASGIIPRGGPGTLERARQALLNFLAASLSPGERAHTTIVFDAAEAPYNLPRELDHEGITVRFAPRESDADTLIEELVLADSSPKRLVVVSSDHRIQRAAHRRRAQAVDSDIWFADLLRRRREREEPPGRGSQKPAGPPTAAEVAYWLREFGADAGETVEGDSPIRRGGSGQSPGEESGQSPMPPGPWNPFPPGYAEDLEFEDEEE